MKESNGTAATKQAPKELKDHHKQLTDQVKKAGEHLTTTLQKGTEHSISKGWIKPEQVEAFKAKGAAFHATLTSALAELEADMQLIEAANEA